MNGIDPESVFARAQRYGYEFASSPTTRSFLFNITLGFWGRSMCIMNKERIFSSRVVPVRYDGYRLVPRLRRSQYQPHCRFARSGAPREYLVTARS